jgi:hypothetical protein
MKTLSTFITETLITENFHTAIGKSKISELVDKHGDELIKMIYDAYKYIGGAIGFETKEDIIIESDLIKTFTKDGKIVAAVYYATKRHPNKDTCTLNDDRSKNFGRKIVCFASLPEYTGYLQKILIEDFKDSRRNVWAEASAKAVSLCLKCGAKPIPSKIAEKILSDKIFTDIKDDEFFYTREIGGKQHTKVLLGNHLFYEHNSDKPLSPDELKHFKELAIKYSKEETN